MSGKKSSPAAPAGQAQPSNPTAVATPTAALFVAAFGGTAALFAGAAISFQGLTGLGALIGIQDPWLLPIAIDIYAATTTLVALILPAGHRARPVVVWNARMGLAMSMAGNAVFRALHLGRFSIGDGMLTFIGAWPSVIVERLLHIQGLLANVAAPTESAPTAETAIGVPGAPSAESAPTPPPKATADSAPRRAIPAPTPGADSNSAPVSAPPTRRQLSAPTAEKSADTAAATGAPAAESTAETVTEIGAARRRFDEWTDLAEPLYRQHLRDHGEHPNGPQLAAHLARAGHGMLGPSRARDVRAAVEKIVAASPEPDSEPEPGREVA